MLQSITGPRYFVSNDLRSDDLACLVLRVLEKLAPCSKASLVAATGESAAGQTILQALLRLEALALIRVAEHEIVITDSGKRFLDDLNSSQSSRLTLHPHHRDCIAARGHEAARSTGKNLPQARCDLDRLCLGGRAERRRATRSLNTEARACWAQQVLGFWRCFLRARLVHSCAFRFAFERRCRELSGRTVCTRWH